jgi:carboxymethylenebutenolidase
MTVRPLDAAGALAYLRTRPDVVPDRIGLQGWSNGGSTVLATISPAAAATPALAPETGFHAALAFYPGCGLKGAFDDMPLLPYAPTLVLHGTADEEVSYRRCLGLVEKKPGGRRPRRHQALSGDDAQLRFAGAQRAEAGRQRGCDRGCGRAVAALLRAPSRERRAVLRIRRKMG